MHGWPRLSRGPHVIELDPTDADTGIVAFNAYLEAGKVKLFSTRDAGETWAPMPDLPDNSGGVLGIVFGGETTVGCVDGVYRLSGDGWVRCTDGLPGGGRAVRSFTGGR